MRLDDLQAASFRGARFLVPSDTAEAGRNVIAHEYPDSNQRYLEDNGLNVANFQVTAVLHGPNIRSDWAQLHRALTRPGVGTLAHPWWGHRRVAVMGRYRVRRDDRNAGVLEVEIPFGETSGANLPGVLSSVPATVGSLAQALFEQVFDDLSAKWSTGGAGGKVTTATALAENLTSLAASVSANVGIQTDAAAQIAAGASARIATGATVSSSLKRLFSEPFDNLELSGSRLAKGFKAVADAVEDIAFESSRVRVRTPESQTRANVLKAFADHTRVAVYGAAAWGMADREHMTADEVEADELFLHDLSRDIQDSETITADTQDALDDVKTTIGEILADRVLRTPRIIGLTSQGVPISVLSYALYDTDEKVSTLLNLNPDKNPIWAENEIKALTVDTD